MLTKEKEMQELNVKWLGCYRLEVPSTGLISLSILSPVNLLCFHMLVVA